MKYIVNELLDTLLLSIAKPARLTVYISILNSLLVYIRI